MSSGSYPTLGFDPAPGTPADVDSLVTSLNAARDCLGDASTLLHNLNSSTDSSWRGKAADAFRDHVSEDVPKALAKAHDSFDKASKALATWSGDLTEYQRQARELESEAAAAKKRLDAAEAHQSAVKANPYRVEGKSTPALEQEAKGKQQAAEGAAASGVSSARDALNDIIARAKTLKSNHDHDASTTAGKVKSAPDHLAPEEPGLFSKIGAWVSDHAGEIGDILSDISAVTGFLALVTPPPFDAVFLGVSVLSSLGALGFHIADGASGWTLAGDALGAVPGIGVVGDAAKGAHAVETVSDGVRFASEAGTMADRAFGARYAASAVGDTASHLSGAASASLEETRVLGSNVSRGIVNSVQHIPGVAISDGLNAAANIDRVVTGTSAVLGANDIEQHLGGGVPVPDGVTKAAGYGGTTYGTAGAILDHFPTIHIR